ncbi:MAG: ABC transporter ATP-binding protein [Armatimonadota bacterium]|nr:MAG: ABC transporter ATP-binding protein [Armatimonadota bacterium]
MSAILELRGLTKKFGNVVAVNDVSLSLEPGDCFGFIGPNGAGKTTTIRVIATLLDPTAGTAIVDGADVTKQPDDVRAVVGYMPDFFGVYDDVTVHEYLDFFASAYRIPFDRRRRIIEDVLELADLASKRDTFVDTLSRGMKQRLCMAKTLVHDPKLLILDEPASGLDPRARVEIKELLRELTQMGKTVFVSSHILPELADICNKIGIIEQGQLLVSGLVQDIMQQVVGRAALRIQIADGECEALAEYVRTVPGVVGARVENRAVVVHCDESGVDQAQLLRELIERGFRIAGFHEIEADLEDVFMRVTRGIVS